MVAYLLVSAFRARLRSPPARKDHRGVDLISDALPFARLHALRRTAMCDWFLECP
jgi:hypothetical protein